MAKNTCAKGRSIFGVVVKPHKPIQFNITVHEGKDLEEVGQPAAVTQKLILVPDELVRLHNEIDLTPHFRSSLTIFPTPQQ